jgi:2,3-bisphosphoglycerate-dependent phosphoglycerate mutase
MTLYLVRHAQSLPRRAQPFSDWQLSPLGRCQAERLAALLDALAIGCVFSSPFVRSLETAGPFARSHGLPVTVMDDLRERLVTSESGPPTDEVWRKSWEDFNFCSPGGESSLAAQARMCRAVRQIAADAKGTTAIFTHGNVIALFLNALSTAFGCEQAERLRNPDIVKLEWKDEAFSWDCYYRLPGLELIATDHRLTPQEQEATIMPVRR